MKALIFLPILFLTSIVFANTYSNDVDNFDEPTNKITPSALRKQFELRGNVFVMSPKGDILYSVGQEMRQWKFSSNGDLTSNWSFSSNEVEFIALKHVWKIDPKGRLSVDVEQYDKKSVIHNKAGKTVYNGKPIKKKSFVIKNFEPVTWVAHSTKKHQIVVRLTPSLHYSREPKQISKLPISAKNMIAADNKGFVWTPEASFSGEYVTLKTSRGTIHISYAPFKGSKEIGYAEDNKMRINLGKKHYLKLISNAHFLPNGLQAKVFGKVNLKEKVSPGSTHIHSSSEEKEFLSSIK